MVLSLEIQDLERVLKKGGTQQGRTRRENTGTINQPEPTAVHGFNSRRLHPTNKCSSYSGNPSQPPTPIIAGSVPEIIDGAGPDKQIL